MDCTNCGLRERIESLESTLKESLEKSSKSRESIYNRLNLLERSDSANNQRFERILEKLDELSDKVEELAKKPGENWQTATKTALTAFVSALVGAVMAFFVGKGG